jgi:hypothetical protein
LTTRSKAGPPAAAEGGSSDVITGPGGPALIARVAGPEIGALAAVPLRTVMVTLPAAAMSAAGTAARRCVVEVRAVTRSAPFHTTTDPVLPVRNELP